MKKYEPYNYSSLEKLMQYFYSKGWYSGTLDLLTIKMQGGFEAFSGRACETWEHRFIASNCSIPEIKIESHEVSGKTLEDACKKLLQVLKEDKENVKQE